MKKSNKKKLISLSIIFILLLSYSPYFNNLFINPKLSTIQEEDISVEWGDNVFENIPYTYSGTFYDDADFEFAWTTANINFTHLESGYTMEDLIIELDNNETQVPTNSSFSMVNGTHHQNGTLNAVDDDYHIFNSTYNKTIAEQPFIIGKGNSTYDGDLEFLDGNYTTFTSEIARHYLGTYSFINDTNGEVPSGWTDESGTGCSATVNQGILDHEKVLDVYDNNNPNIVKVNTTFTGQTSGTIEWWWMNVDGSYAFIMIWAGADVPIHLSTISSTYYYDLGGWQSVRTRSHNVWYHHRIDFECGAGGYMGLPADTFDWYINGVIEANDMSFRVAVDDIDTFRITTEPAQTNVHIYFDAFGITGVSDYNVGDNQDIEPLDLEIEVNMNLNSFSNLNETYLVYSYRTNISQICNYSIYNFDSSSYDVIENDVNLAFVNSYFPLNSSYYNATNDMILSFVMSNTISEFEMRLDRLLVRKPSYLNFSTTVSFDTLTLLLQMDINSYQRSNISQLINMSAWNYTTSSWTYLNGSSFITTFQLLQWVNTVFSGYIDSNGDVLLMYYGVNITDTFQFELEALNITLWRKTIVQYKKTLYLLGTWKYRFTLDEGLGTEHITEWIYFDLVPQEPNFQGVSESPYTTRWQLTSTAVSSNYVNKYSEDFTGSYWDLTGTADPVIHYTYNPEDAYVDNYYAGTNYGGTTISYVYNEEEVQGYVYIYPNNDRVLNEWHSDTAQHHDSIDEGTVLDWRETYADATDDQEYEEYDLTTIDIGGGTITKVTAHFFTSGGIVGEYVGEIDLNIGSWLGVRDLIFDFDFMGVGGWYSKEWTGLSLSQADLNIMWVRIRAPITITSGTRRLWSLYFKVDYTIDFDRYKRTFVKCKIPYLLNNITGNSEFKMKTSTGGYYPSTIDIYQTSSFNEGTITYTNQPASIGGALDNKVVNADNTWYSFDLGGTPYEYYVLKTNNLVVKNGIIMYSSEHGTPANRPILEHYISKIYQDTVSGYAYMQSGGSETLGLLSNMLPSNISISRTNFDFITVICQTTAANINLKLYSGGILQKTLTVLKNNVITTEQEIEIAVSSDITFDRLEFIYLLTNTEYFKVIDVSIDGYDYDEQEQTTIFYVDPDGSKEVIIPNLGLVDLKVYDNDVLRHKETFNLTTELTTKIYKREVETIVYVNFFDTDNNWLEFNQFITTVNYTLDNFLHENKRMANNFLYVDDGSNINFIIKDSFDFVILSESCGEQKFLDIVLDVYELKIKNEYKNPVPYILKNIATAISKTGNIFTGEIIKFRIANGTYNFNYSKDYGASYEGLTIDFYSDMILVVNQSKICFLSYADQQGNYLSFNNYKTYIDDVLIYENIFYREIGDSFVIKVKDRYNITIEDDVYTVVSGDNYIPITLTMYSLKVMSLQLVFNHVNITRDADYYGANPYSWSTWLAPRETTEFKLFAGYYVINITNFEDGGWTQYDYTLSGDAYILIGSNNTIYNVLVNIANVNTTIGNQLTNIEINITNQNSAINNTVINIEINLDNINSSLGNMLVDIDTAISNINTSIVNEIVSLGTVINNINTSITNQILDIGVNITNMNSSIMSQLLTLGVDISNINGSIINQILALGVDVSNFNTSISNQILSIGVDISNLDTSITNQLVSIVADIENVETQIDDQTITILADITNVNSTLLNQMISLGVDVSNINVSITNQILSLGVDISNLDTSITNQIVSLGVNITNINTTISDQLLSLEVDITNINNSIISQILTLGVDISNINGSIINQIVSLGVDITNINTSISNQILSLEVDITNINTSIIDQILLVVADIENVNTTIYDQTLVMLADITNVNSTLLNQMISLGVDVSNINVSITNQILSLGVDLTNINTTIYNQILSLNIDLTNINTSISNLLFYLDVDITNIANNISNLYTFTENSFINIDNTINTSFIYLENNIISFNQSISNLVIGVSNDIYLINGTISTMITSIGTNLLLMNVSIDTSLFNLNTTLNLIGSNITSNYILLNNSIDLTNLNINDSRIAMINNLLLINNTISTLIADVYSAVYLINNSIYTAVVDLGTYLSLINNTINGNLSIILEMNEFLTEIYKMTMFSELLNWTNIGLNTSLLTSQIDAWEFINNYRNQSIEVHLRYQGLIDNLTVSAQNTFLQHLPKSGVEYREWSVDLQEYVGEWKALPDNMTVDFGFFEDEVPIIPLPQFIEVLQQWAIVIVFILIFAIIGLFVWYKLKKEEMKKERKNPNGYVSSMSKLKKTPWF